MKYEPLWSVQSPGVILISWAHIDAMLVLVFVCLQVFPFVSHAYEPENAIEIRVEHRAEMGNWWLLSRVSLATDEMRICLSIVRKTRAEISACVWEKDKHSSEFKINKTTPKHKRTMTVMRMIRMNGCTDESFNSANNLDALWGRERLKRNHEGRAVRSFVSTRNTRDVSPLQRSHVHVETWTRAEQLSLLEDNYLSKKSDQAIRIYCYAVKNNI